MNDFKLTPSLSVQSKGSVRKIWRIMKKDGPTKGFILFPSLGSDRSELGKRLIGGLKKKWLDTLPN